MEQIFNYKVVLEYDGTNYKGLQIQKSSPLTIHELIYNALKKVLNVEPIALNFCGRTDAGVHALGQVFNVKTTVYLPGNKLALGLNYNLRGKEITALSAEIIEEEFHARHTCKQRVYVYKILNRPLKSPLLKDRVWFVPFPLNIGKMQEISQLFIGTRNFGAFRNTDCTANTTIKTVDYIKIRQNGEMIEIEVAAKSFLYNMVRNIVGAIVDVTRGKLDVGLVKQMLETGVATQKKMQTAPACGLYFKCAEY